MTHCLIWLLAASYLASSAQASWKFIAVGDSQGYEDGVNATILSELASETVGHDVECVLFCGDLVSCYYPYDLESELETWRGIMQPVYDAGIPIYSCRGNHESWGTVAEWQGVFGDLPDNGPAGEKHMTYSVVHKNSLIVALDEYVNPHRVNQAWLDTQLKRNAEPLVFIFGHEPAFHMFHPDCLDDYPADRDRFWNSIRDAGGRTYFTGHDHFFNHAHADDGDGDPNNDVHQFTSGTAGASFYSFSPPYAGDNSRYTVEQVHHARRYGYVLTEVNDLNVSLTWMQRHTNDLESAGVYEPNAVWSFSAKPLILLSPNGGERIIAGSVFDMRWRTYESVIIENVLLDYSTDDGENWTGIDAVPNTGSYDWNVPIVDSHRCLVRVTDSDNPATSDTSYKAFSIIMCPCDTDCDGDVDFNDYAALAASWKSRPIPPDHNPPCHAPDPNRVLPDYHRLSVFCGCWLAGTE